MPLDYEKLINLEPIAAAQSYNERDTIMYALGVGVGIDDPISKETLRFAYEEGLEALPTMAVVLASPGFWLKDPRLGVDWRRLLHGEQSVVLHRPLPAAADLTSVTTVDAIYDKGADRGALLYASRVIRSATSGEQVATVRLAYFLRGDGGFGGRADGAPQPHPIPTDRAPDASIDMATRRDQALLYRLSGDYNALHIAPEAARVVGFDRPILHGLCTYGIAGRAALKLLCDDDPTRLRRFDGRFSSPVYPGDSLRIEVWREGRGRAALRVLAPERGVTVLQNGLVEFKD